MSTIQASRHGKTNRVFPIFFLTLPGPGSRCLRTLLCSFSCAASSRSLHFACYAPIQIWAEPANVAQLSTLIQSHLSKPPNCFCITYGESLHTCFSDRLHKAGKFPGWGGGCPIFVPPSARAHTRAHLPREHALRERERACAHGCAWLYAHACAWL